ncbi:FAD-dependent oxidoreductase [Tenacibaculum sp. 190524A02b]|uniref:FAD-binding oxidoreductase n=1 Tax=Tenacibaculum vairaonense TaxID=3137860 RepID=UPI0031FB26E2
MTLIKQETTEKLLKHHIDDFLKEIKGCLPSNVEISTNWGSLEDVFQHTKKSQIFNRRLQFNPFVIVFCEQESDVLTTYQAAKNNNLPIKVRAGGHDHEGECTGTNIVLIDVSKMSEAKQVKIDPATKVAHIPPGIRFQTLTSELAKHDVMIPHGTCATVGISGFTMGGGWGPWTRKEGMCCEHLVGANIILGDGTLHKIEAKGNEVPELLWALRGGGGLSYGIVTELRIQTFPLPPVLHRFDLTWNPYEDNDPDSLIEKVPTLKVLQKWENIIKSEETPQLTGTNLKINGRPWEANKPVPSNISHNCVFYGYWEGTEESLDKFITKNFTDDLTPSIINIEPPTGADYGDKEYGLQLMSSWDRESLYKIRLKMSVDLQGTPLQPDEDEPAPHKITSRLVNKNGLDANNQNGYQKLLESLSSDLLLEGNRALGLFNYVTLGAIVGDFYKNNIDKTNSAFPYKDKLYTIQYQCWWNEIEFQKQEFQDNFVYDRTNRALDWIEVSRDYDIPNTSGAFISFKDSSIPTKTYFDKSYHRLIEIKENYSKDKYNHFRSRKTII